MDVLVDGHNLIFVAAQRDGRYAVEQGERARDELLALLSRYQAVRGDRVVCFFDGGRRAEGLPRRSFGHGMQIQYSDPRSDADTEIKNYVAAHAEPAGLRVVTGDRAIQVFVQKYGAKVTSSRAFLAEMEDTLSDDTRPADEPIEKYETPDDAEMGYWLGVFGEDEEE